MKTATKRPAARPLPNAGDVERVLSALGSLPEPRPRPALLVVSGLPGTGKSRLCRSVASETGAAVLESDSLRRLLFRRPSHSYLESRRLFAAIHAAIDRLLSERRSCILDATNLAEWEREPLYGLAARRRARLLLVRVVAPERTAIGRLRRRARGEDPLGSSSADVAVYRRMAANQEDILRPHRVVESTRGMVADVQSIVKEMLEP